MRHRKMASFQWKEPRSLNSRLAVIWARNTSSLSLSTDTFSLSVNITETNSCVTFTMCCFCNELSIYHLFVYIYFSYCTTDKFIHVLLFRLSFFFFSISSGYFKLIMIINFNFYFIHMNNLRVFKVMIGADVFSLMTILGSFFVCNFLLYMGA